MAYINCPDCGRRKSESLAHWFQEHNGETCAPRDPDQEDDGDESTAIALDDCQRRTIARLRTQLATAEAKLVEAERENAAWRALAEWERYTNDRSVSVNDGGMLPVGSPFNMDACDGPDVFYGHGETAGMCAIALATKLGLIDKEGG